MKSRKAKFFTEICISVLIAGFFLFITYWTMNYQIPISAEKAKLQFFEAYRLSHWPREDSNLTDSVIMIDTHYDQQFVMEKDPYSSLENGLVPVVDREKLLRCLEYLKQRKEYKYILLDIFFDKAVRQDADSTLYKTIASMPRLLLAKPQDIPIADPCLAPKTGRVQYKTALWENDFVKYPFSYEGEKSLSLMMYEDKTGRTIKKWGPLYWDKGLARNSIILTYPNVDLDERSFLGGSDDYPIEEVLKDACGKYILIGDFEDDLHNTFLGEIPGTLINFYAFLALFHGHHKIGIGMFFSLLLVFAIPVYLKISNYRIPKRIYYFIRKYNLVNRIISFLKDILCKPKKNRLFEVIRSILYFSYVILSKLFSSWIGYPLYLTIVCLYTYVVFNEAYDIFITTLLFYLLNVIWDSYQEYLTKSNRQ